MPNQEGGFHETIQHIFIKFGTVSTLKLSEFNLGPCRNTCFVQITLNLIGLCENS